MKTANYLLIFFYKDTLSIGLLISNLNYLVLDLFISFFVISKCVIHAWWWWLSLELKYMNVINVFLHIRCLVECHFLSVGSCSPWPRWSLYSLSLSLSLWNYDYNNVCYLLCNMSSHTSLCVCGSLEFIYKFTTFSLFLHLVSAFITIITMCTCMHVTLLVC